MPGVTERHPSHGPRLTYFPWTSVIGGRLCEPDPANDGYIRHASAGSLTVVGMANKDATKKDGGAFAISPRQQTGLIINAPVSTDVVCVDDGVYDVEVTAPLARGQRMICGAAGKFAPWDGTAAGIVVARNVGKALTSADVTAGVRARVRLIPA